MIFKQIRHKGKYIKTLIFNDIKYYNMEDILQLVHTNSYTIFTFRGNEMLTLNYDFNVVDIDCINDIENININNYYTFLTKSGVLKILRKSKNFKDFNRLINKL